MKVRLSPLQFLHASFKTSAALFFRLFNVYSFPCLYRFDEFLDVRVLLSKARPKCSRSLTIGQYRVTILFKCTFDFSVPLQCSVLFVDCRKNRKYKVIKLASILDQRKRAVTRRRRTSTFSIPSPISRCPCPVKKKSRLQVHSTKRFARLPIRSSRRIDCNAIYFQSQLRFLNHHIMTKIYTGSLNSNQN